MSGQDTDDWFGAEGHAAQEHAAGEDWLVERPAPARPWLELVDRRVVVVAAIGVGFVIAVLAAAGVFSSSSRKPTALPLTPVVTTPVTQQTTTPVTTTVETLPAPTVPLKPGDNGAQVEILQRALVHLGLLDATPNGQFGPATQAAVEKFQASVGITADGVVGPATRAALATALKGP